MSDEKARISIDTYREAAEFKRIGNRAVRKAQEENRRAGVPNVYAHRRHLYFELPSGEITDKDPFLEESSDS